MAYHFGDLETQRLFHCVELKFAYDGTTDLVRLPRTRYVPTGRRYLQTFRGICLQALAKGCLVSRETPKILYCGRDVGVTIKDEFQIAAFVKNSREADEMRFRMQSKMKYNTQDGKPIYPSIYHHVGKKFQQITVKVIVKTQINLEHPGWEEIRPTFPRIWKQMGIYRHYLKDFARPREIGLCRNNCMCGRCVSIA